MSFIKGCVSSPMDTVTESYMVIAMASLGRIGILHSNNTPQEQLSLLQSTKFFHIPFISNFEIKSPADVIDSESNFGFSNVIVIIETCSRKSRVLGFESDWEKLMKSDELLLKEGF